MYYNDQMKQERLGTQSSISSKGLQEYNQMFICPISCELMNNPSDLPCGHTFQTQNIKQVLQKLGQCPLCRRKTKVDQMRKNLFAKQSIQLYKQQIQRKQLQKQKKLIQSIQKSNIKKEQNNKPKLPFPCQSISTIDQYRYNPLSGQGVILTPQQLAVYDAIKEMETEMFCQFIDSGPFGDFDSDIFGDGFIMKSRCLNRFHHGNIQNYKSGIKWFKQNFMDIYLQLFG